MKRTSRRRGAPSPQIDQVVIAAFARIDAIALGCALGVLFGLIAFGATIILVLKGGTTVGPRLALLGQYFPGYAVTPAGGVAGFVYGFGVGFAAGWLLASLRNLCLAAYLRVIRMRAELSAIHDVVGPE